MCACSTAEACLSFDIYSIFISTASHPDVDEEIDYLSSVIAKQQMSEVKQPGLNYLFFKSVWWWLVRLCSGYGGHNS